MVDNDLFITALEAVKIEAESVTKALSCIDKKAFIDAARLLTSAPRIVTTACGTSGMAAMKFAHLLCCIDRPAKFISPSEAVHGGLGFIQQRDVVVFISKGGNTQELNQIIDISQKRGAVTISVTENPESYLARRSDIFLRSFTLQEVGKNNILSTSSFMVSVAILDALICTIMELTDFDINSFSVIHPGGEVGRKLLLHKDEKKELMEE